MLTPDLTRLTYFRGRVALAAILRGLGIGAGDEVIIPAFTCIAVPEALLSIGARPVYVDVEEGGINMDPAELDRTLGDNTRAVVVQHSFGLPADMSRISASARRRGVPLIEDCAHTISSRVDGRTVGSFGAAAIYSYEAAKPVFAGIGGSAVSNDDVLSAALIREYPGYHEPPKILQLQLGALFLAHRTVYRPSTYWTVRALYRAVSATGLIRGSYNKVETDAAPADDFGMRMGALQKRLLRNGLKRLEIESTHRMRVADRYRTGINSPAVTHIPVPSSAEPVFGRYPMLVENRDVLVERARKAKVEIAVFYSTPVHPLEGEGLRKVGYEPGSCPNAEWVSDRIVSLPTGTQVTEREIQRAIKLFNEHDDGRA